MLGKVQGKASQGKPDDEASDIMCKGAPFHDIRFWNGMLTEIQQFNIFFKKYFQQVEFDHYYKYMIITGRLCHIM